MHDKVKLNSVIRLVSGSLGEIEFPRNVAMQLTSLKKFIAVNSYSFIWKKFPFLPGYLLAR